MSSKRTTNLNTEKLQSAAATEAFVLSQDPRKAMQEMMQTIDALRVVYVQETAALKNADTNAFLNLQDQKIKTAQDYHAGISQMFGRKDEIMMVHPELKSLLRKKQEEFSAVAKENLDAIERMRRTVDRLGSRIMQAARDAAARESVNYSAKGSLNAYRNKPVTMGLNESA